LSPFNAIVFSFIIRISFEWSQTRDGVILDYSAHVSLRSTTTRQAITTTLAEYRTEASSYWLTKRPHIQEQNRKGRIQRLKGLIEHN